MNRTPIQLVKQAISVIRSERKQLDGQLEILEQTLAALQALEEKPTEPHRNGQTGHNVEVISSILEQQGKPLTVRMIAHSAFDSGEITSAKGYKGVYNIVQTVLNRNSKSTFMKVGRGEWSLRNYRQKRSPVTSVAQPDAAS